MPMSMISPLSDEERRIFIIYSINIIPKSLPNIWESYSGGFVEVLLIPRTGVTDY